jgi:isoaspartyl peptidase/L-asparaginase-like protein (Ntn-hydrolase superfamily)
MTIQRRTFFKWGLTGIAISLFKPVKATEYIDQTINVDLKPGGPIVLSTWNHGLTANKAAWEVLSKGGKSLDAVEQAARITESDVKNRSVGIGGMPDRDGHVTLDACIMDENSRCGSVAFLEGIAHPISVARKIMESTQHVMLVGEGAKQFAIQHGFDRIKTPLPEVKDEWKKWKAENKDLFKKPDINHENHDTIGIIALDADGNLSGACTTSGWAYKLPGRVGDSPIIGAGLFVDNEVGAAVATGLGEAIIRVAGSHTVVELMRQGFSPQEACQKAVERIISKHKDMTGLQCGFLALDKFGNVGAYSSFNGFNYAKKTHKEEALIDATFNRKW